MTKDQQAAILFVSIMVVGITALFLVVVIMQAREKYGMMPRGLRWMETGIPAARDGVQGLARRIFYGDVLKEREAEKLRIERETGMTPWWDAQAQRWRQGDVKEIKNQYGFVTARRPQDYSNRVATPGVPFQKGEKA
ncbi:hypothetical protein SEA_LAZERLEMON_64 [Streptomyces phage LazerLemon]|nr:hypothetical protein SEA_LAZERLEMON_64 [Streptomyces phage LazerLemon]